jgi:hypothetical protein
MAFQNGHASLRGVLAPLVVFICLLLPILGRHWQDWLVNDAEMMKTDVRRAKRGYAIRVGTTDNAVIAEHAAGNIPYLAESKTRG